MNTEEPKRSVPSLEKAKRRYKWKRLFAKKWFFPAVYMVVAALILAIAWWYQQHPFQQVTNPSTNGKQDEILPVEEIEQMVQPVKQGSEAEKTIGYYDESSTKDSKQTSLIKYANTYWPHTGLDFARKDGKTFEVVAALAGKVIRVEENPIVGRQVAIQHENGTVTVYQSLENIKVEKGQLVEKGDVLAQAGRNNFEKDAGVHLHFEVHQENKPVNPANFLP